MATIVTHAAVAACAGIACSPRIPRGLLALAALCAMAPDFDVVSFRLGIPYEHMLGHRGITHSLAFAALLGWLLARALPRAWLGVDRRVAGLVLALATASHGVIDAMTEGGLGVAFFAPFDQQRYLFPFRPVEASPIGHAFFSRDGLEVIGQEIAWLWVPALLAACGAVVLRRVLGARPLPQGQPIDAGQRHRHACADAVPDVAAEIPSVAVHRVHAGVAEDDE